MCLQLSSLRDRFNFERLRSDSGALTSRFSNIKSLSDFFDFRRVSKPESVGEAHSRITFNLGYFSTNYSIIFVLLSLYALLTNILLLFIVVFVIIGFYVIGRLEGADLEIGGKVFTTSQLYSGLFGISIVLGIFASPISTILWLVGASIVTIGGHAALMEKPVESEFNEQTV